jgi:hypothetical protein
MPRRGIAPASFVLVVVIAIWLVSGVSAGDIVKFVAYEIAFVCIPGAALLWAVRGRPYGPLLTIGLGWPLGQALEILAFSATAASGLRGLFVAFPVVVTVPCAVIIWRRRSRASGQANEQPTSGLLLWAAAVTMALGLVYLVFAFFPQAPLPSLSQPVQYFPDFTDFIGLTAEAKNHWPATSPGLSGFPLHYEWFVFDHMAAVSQVTGVAIPTIGFRLDFVPTMLVLGCQLMLLGRLLGRSAWTGVLAMGVMFLLGPLDLTRDLGQQSPFLDQFNFHLWASWTFAFGLMFLFALLYLLTERLQDSSWRSAASLRAWVVIALLMFGASGAKATILPVVITGTGLYGVLELWRRRRLPANAIVAVVLGVVMFVLTFLVVYGGGVPGTVIQPLAVLNLTVPEIVASHISSHALRDIARLVGYAVGLVCILLPLAGGLYLLRPRHRAQLQNLALCLCFVVTGVLIANVVHQVGDSELYFLDTGFAAGIIAAAAGLRLAWLDLGTDIPISRRNAVVAFMAWIALIAVVVVATSPSDAHPAGLLLRYTAIAAAAVIFVVVAAFLVRARHAPVAGVIALALIPILAASALTLPIQLAPTARRVLDGRPITVTEADPQTVRGLTPGLLLALEWLRDNTPISTVFAVSNHWVDPAETNGRYYYYSAFSERQVFVEPYNPVAYGLNYPPETPGFAAYQYRTRLNDAVFDDASTSALRILTQQYDVRFLFIDRLHHNADPALLQFGRVVFSDDDATILAVS